MSVSEDAVEEIESGEEYAEYLKGLGASEEDAQGAVDALLAKAEELDVDPFPILVMEPEEGYEE